MLCVLGMNDDVSMYGVYIYAYEYQIGRTALYMASESGHREVVQLLLEHGADTKPQNNVSHTPLPLPFPPSPSPTPAAIIIVTRVRLDKLL